ncbi:MAG: YfiR family protein [Methylococcales bacterium]|nr:YfiR family protein [Methylococcales bacterium]
MDILTRKLTMRFLMVLLSMMLFATGSIESIAENYKTTQKQKVIAGAIYKFIKFVEWDAGLIKNKKTFNVCLQHYDSAFEPLTKRTIQNKPIRLHLMDNENFKEDCHVLFLNAKESDFTEILKKFTHKATLTISEQAGFASQGGIIELGNHNNRLIFSISLLSAKASQLNIGFQLLSLAHHVIKN